MPVISFANPKGGAGKTTCALILAGELAMRGATVALVDADPEQWISQWASAAKSHKNIKIHNQVTEDTIVDVIEAASGEASFVIVDLEGTASLMVANAVGMSDLVIIPAQGTSMDGKGAAKTIKLVRNQERMARRQIPHSVLITRTSAAVVTRSTKNLRNQLSSAGIDVFLTSIVERAAFRDMFDYASLLSDLDPERVANIDKARQNASEFAGEVIMKLKQTAAKQGQAQPMAKVA